LYAGAELVKLGSAILGGAPDFSTPAPNLGAIGSELGLVEPGPVTYAIESEVFQVRMDAEAKAPAEL
jgi:hypothetical protein